MKNTTKKIFSLLFCIALLCGMFGCGTMEKDDRVWILVDLEESFEGKRTDGANLLINIEKTFDIDRDNYYVEFLPEEEGERSMRIKQLRTEIMAGGGPDVFFFATDIPNRPELPHRERLFIDMNKLVRNRKFLPLDDFAGQARYMDLDLFAPAMKEACSVDGKMTVLPITYTFPAAVMLKKDRTELPANIEEAASCDDETVKEVYGRSAKINFPDLCNPKVDYDAERLVISEEDLKKTVKTALALSETESGEPCFVMSANHMQTKNKYSDGRLYEGVSVWRKGSYHYFAEAKDEEQTLVPLRDLNGGVSAAITSYICINANTKRPDDAFKVVDLMASRSMQGDMLSEDAPLNSARQTYLAEWTYGFPARLDLMKDQSNKYYFSVVSGWSPKKDNAWEDYCELRDSVTDVRFYSVIDTEMQEMYLQCKTAASPEEVDKTVKRFYDVMNQRIAE